MPEETSGTASSAAADELGLVQRLERRLARERAIRLEAERLLETKSLELFEANRKLAQLNAALEVQLAASAAEAARVRNRAAHWEDIDKLTGLPNRVRALAALREALAGCLEAGQGVVALALCDVQGLRAINRQYGYGVGDGVLVAAGSRLREAARAQDVVARMGDHAFAVIMVLADQAEVAAAVAGFAPAFAYPVQLDGQQLRIEVALRVAVAPGNGVSAEGLVGVVDG